MDTLPVAFIAAAAAMLIGQGIKIFSPVLHGRKPEPANFRQSGGMPSAHTAAVAAMMVVVGLRDGFGSTAFSISAVLTAVVAHDAVKVRGTVNSIIRVLRDTVPEETIEKAGKLPETIGHSIAEAAAGFILAGLVGTACHLLLP